MVFYQFCDSVGQVYEKMEDENTACHWHTEAHRHYPVNLNVIRYVARVIDSQY